MTKNRFTAFDLELLAAVDRPLINAKGESVRFLVVDITAPITPAIESGDALKAPLNLALVIDASGSMQGEPIEAAKEAARLLAESLGGADTLSVVSFDTGVETHVDGLRQDAAGQATAIAAFASLTAGSSTNLGGGWLQGCACVARVMEREPGQRNRVVVLSDGMANHGIVEPDALATHAAELRARGLLSSAVGIGEQYSDTQLEAIAGSGGGRLHHAAGAQEIVELVLGELEEMRETVVESCDLTVELPAGFRAEVVGDYATTLRDGRIACAIGSLPSGGKRTVVLKLACPAGALGAEPTLEVATKWTAVGGADAVETVGEACRFQYATGSHCLAQPRDRELALRVALAWQLWLVRAATRLNQDGELRRAAELVARELKFFVKYCDELPGAKALIDPLKRLQRTIGERQYDRRSAKEMMVSSRKATRGERELRVQARTGWESHLPK